MTLCNPASLVAWLLVVGTISAPALFDTETVEVAKSDGSLQCEKDSGISLSKMQRGLASEGIEVFSSRHSRDCLMRTQVCGQSTGVLNVYRIRMDQLEAAVSLGFSPLTDFCK